MKVRGAIAAVLVLAACGSSHHASAPPPRWNCSSLSQCVHKGEVAAGRRLLVPAAAGVRFSYGASTDSTSPDGGGFDLFLVQSGRAFEFVAGGNAPFVCPPNDAERIIHSPRGFTDCYVRSVTATKVINIRTLRDGVLYIFSWFHKTDAPTDEHSALGRWALATMDDLAPLR